MADRWSIVVRVCQVRALTYCFLVAAHTCSVCLRAFAIPSNLKRHLKLHAKEGRGSTDSTASGPIAEAEEGEEGSAIDDEPEHAGRA